MAKVRTPCVIPVSPNNLVMIDRVHICRILLNLRIFLQVCSTSCQTGVLIWKVRTYMQTLVYDVINRNEIIRAGTGHNSQCQARPTVVLVLCQF